MLACERLFPPWVAGQVLGCTQHAWVSCKHLPETLPHSKQKGSCVSSPPKCIRGDSQRAPGPQPHSVLGAGDGPPPDPTQPGGAGKATGGASTGSGSRCEVQPGSRRAQAGAGWSEAPRRAEALAVCVGGVSLWGLGSSQQVWGTGEGPGGRRPQPELCGLWGSKGTHRQECRTGSLLHSTRLPAGPGARNISGTTLGDSARALAPASYTWVSDGGCCMPSAPEEAKASAAGSREDAERRGDGGQGSGRG